MVDDLGQVPCRACGCELRFQISGFWVRLSLRGFHSHKGLGLKGLGCSGSGFGALICRG